MIARIKILKNQAEIEKAQKAVEVWMHQNPEGDIKDRPGIPDAEFDTTVLLLDVEHISLAYINATGGINVDYKDKSFVLIYEDEVWEELSQAFETKQRRFALSGL